MKDNATSWKSQTYHPGTSPCSRKRTFAFVLSLSQCFTFSLLTLCPDLLLGSWLLLSISSVPVSAHTTGQAGAGIVRGHRGEGGAGLRGLRCVLLTQAPCHQCNAIWSNDQARPGPGHGDNHHHSQKQQKQQCIQHCSHVHFHYQSILSQIMLLMRITVFQPMDLGEKFKKC